MFRLIYKATFRVQLIKLFYIQLAMPEETAFWFPAWRWLYKLAETYRQYEFLIIFYYILNNKVVLDSQLIYISLIIFNTTVIPHL